MSADPAAFARLWRAAQAEAAACRVELAHAVHAARVEGRSMAEIAADTGLTFGQVRQLTREALLALGLDPVEDAPRQKPGRKPST